MSFFTKNRIKNWLLIFLLVTNIATIGTILYHRWSFHKHMQEWQEKNPRQKMKDFINNELGLSAEQKTKIDNERKISDSTRESLMDKMENLRISVYSQFSLTNTDQTIIDSLVNEMSSLYSEANQVGISHNLFMLNNCTPEQKAKLKKKYEEMVNDMKAEQKREKEEDRDN